MELFEYQRTSFSKKVKRRKRLHRLRWRRMRKSGFFYQFVADGLRHFKN